MKKINITNRLKEQLQEKGKKEENQIIDNSIKEEELKDILNLDGINSISEDQELVKFLKESTIKLFNIQAKSVVLIGEVLTNVFEKLAKQGSQDGIYEKWLKLNNFNKQTALRYRKRYELYSIVNNKETIAIMPQKYIDILYSEEDKEKYINIINNGGTYEEVVNLLKDKTTIPEKIEYNNIIDFDFRNCNTLFIDIEKKIENLKEKEKKELQKYLIKIQEILN